MFSAPCRLHASLQMTSWWLICSQSGASFLTEDLWWVFSLSESRCWTQTDAVKFCSVLKQNTEELSSVSRTGLDSDRLYFNHLSRMCVWPTQSLVGALEDWVLLWIQSEQNNKFIQNVWVDVLLLRFWIETVLLFPVSCIRISLLFDLTSFSSVVPKTFSAMKN